MLNRNCKPAEYNLLPSAVEAETQVNANVNSKLALELIGNYFVKEKVNDVLSVKLLHRHNGLKEGEFMVEMEKEYQGKPALITLRDEWSGDKELIPSMVKLDHNENIVMEYSLNDVIEKDLLEKCKEQIENKSHINTVHSILKEYGLEDWLGLGIRAKRFYNRDVEGHRLYEETDIKNVMNVVTWSQADGDRTIQTQWIFDEKTDIADPQNWSGGPPRCRPYTRCVMKEVTICRYRVVGHEKTITESHQEEWSHL